jgi:ribonuclease R
MSDFTEQILSCISRKGYEPLKPKALARKLGATPGQYPAFRQALRDLLKQGRVELGRNHTIRPSRRGDAVTGVYRRIQSGSGFVRPHVIDGKVGEEVFIVADDALDAATGDTVLVRVTKKARGERGLAGRVVQVLERATRQFVGTYFEREGQGLVRVDGTVFSHSVFVGDPDAKGARPDDKVVLELLRFPTPDDPRGEGVIVEVLGPRGKPGVDTLAVLREFSLPVEFPREVLEEGRQAVTAFDELDLKGREDFTQEVVVTIDPVGAHDFDDAISLRTDPHSGHWQLGVHIADVAHFVPVGSELDREARKRGNSVYLPQKVIPMLPETISNGLASLQQGKLRYVKSVLMDFTPTGQRAAVRLANAAIRVRRRFAYEQVSQILRVPTDATGVTQVVLDLLLRMHDLAMILRKRRLKRGALELSMPEVELDYDERGRVHGAHLHKHDVSNQIIEEFMLAANEAVAQHLTDRGIAFLRRVHPAPQPNKLRAFAEFARLLGYKVDKYVDRFSLQRVLDQSADRPERHAIHYALLRSLKQATYDPQEEGHYALASENYCHFTSPIRRYPDLTVHRLIDHLLNRGRAGSDVTELATLGEHCSKTERRAEMAERTLVKLKLLNYLSERLGTEMDAVITGVADYGFFAQGEQLPVEGLVHISTLPDDYYYFEEESHSLTGQRGKKRYRLGDPVRVEVVHVDVSRRQLDFRVISRGSRAHDTSPTRKRGRQ